MRSLLLYNLYPKKNWQEITDIVLKNVPLHDDIIVNITLDRWDRIIKKHKYIQAYLKKIPKIQKVIFTLNNPMLGEVPAFDNLRKQIKYDNYNIVTYCHSKGVTKPKNKNILDWVKLMTYFLIERHDLCIATFKQGYKLYGTQLHHYQYDRIREKTYKYCDYWYAGTFFSVNLDELKREFISTNCPPSYYGVEAFPGLLCDSKFAYCAHKSPYSLYDNPYPEHIYKV